MKKRVVFDPNRLEEPLLAACEDIIDASEKLNTQLLIVQVDKNGFDNASLEEEFQKMVFATSTAIRLTEEWFDLGQDDVLLGLLPPVAKKVRKNVLNYVPLTKAAFSNHMDYLTRNAQAQAFVRVDKFTRGLCAIVEILHRKRLRRSGMNFGYIDQMDAECILLIKLANNLTTESRNIITLALQGNQLEIFTNSDSFLQALNDFCDVIPSHLNRERAREHKSIKGQHQSIIALSQDVKRVLDSNPNNSREDLDERGASISTQIIDSTIELIIITVSSFQSEWQKLIDNKEKNAATINNNNLRLSADNSIGPKRPQKPNRTKSGKDLAAVANRNRSRSVRTDYERKYGVTTSFSDANEESPRFFSTDEGIKRSPVKRRSFRATDPASLTRKRTSEPVPLSKQKSNEYAQMYSQHNQNQVSVVLHPKELKIHTKQKKKKRRSFTFRSRSSSTDQQQHQQQQKRDSDILTVFYADGDGNIEEKLERLFKDPNYFSESTEFDENIDAPVRTTVSKSKNKKRQALGKSVPTADAKYLRSAPISSGASNASNSVTSGVPVFVS